MSVLAMIHIKLNLCGHLKKIMRNLRSDQLSSDQIRSDLFIISGHICLKIIALPRGKIRDRHFFTRYNNSAVLAIANDRIQLMAHMYSVSMKECNNVSMHIIKRTKLAFFIKRASSLNKITANRWRYR